MPTRREALVATLGLAAGAIVPAGAATAGSLDALARRTGRRFGAAIGSGPPGAVTGSFADPKLRALVAEQCGVPSTRTS